MKKHELQTENMEKVRALEKTIGLQLNGIAYFLHNNSAKVKADAKIKKGVK